MVHNDRLSMVSQIYIPTGTMLKDDPLNITADGRFSDKFTLSGSFDLTGEYRIVATYRGEYQGQTTFLYEGQVTRDYSCALSVCTYPLNIGNKTYPINYRISGILNNITADTEKRSL